MTLQKYIGEIPEINRAEKNNKMLSIIKDFIAMQTKTATVAFDSDEYTNDICGYRSLSRACKDSCEPVKAVYRQGIIFLVRTDM